MNRSTVVLVALVVSGGCKKDQELPKADPSEAALATAPKAVTAKAEVTAKGPDVARGAYLAKAGGCLTCHMGMTPTGPDVDHPGEGGLEIPDPAGGTWRTPNITLDKSSGIGSWTDDQIARAIREGVRPDGSQLYAIMPYANYNRLTDDDTKALVAFLHTLKPVDHVVAPNKDLKFPKLAMPNPANAPDVTTDPVKHGEYLATVMLCNHCHWTPDAHMAPAGPDKMFSGGLELTIPMFGTGKLYSPNITSDPDTGIGKWTEEQIATTIKTMTKPDGKMISPPMLLLQGGWSQLADADLKAVAKFIHQLPPVKNKVTASTFKFTPPGPPPSGSPPAATPAKKG